MLTFEGKAVSFVPGKEVPNKEPPVSKFVVEKLYKVHRERLRDMQPVVDCHVEIPDFLTNQSWKKITEEHRREVIRMHNEVIYQRIAKVENAESAITVANRKHIKHVENELKLMKNLKEKGRVRNILKIQRENEDLLQRIERARPEYTRKNISEWYKHHELFKKGRRSDPTAGHLGFRSLKGLFPKPIPRVNPSNVDMALDAASLRESQESVSRAGAGSLSSVPRSRRTPRARASTAVEGHSMLSMREASAFGEAFPYTKPQTSPHRGGGGGGFGLDLRLPNSRPSSAGTPGRGSHAGHSLVHSQSQPDARQAADGEDDEDDEDNNEDDQDGFHVLLSRAFAIPFEATSCSVFILACSRSYDENLYVRVMSNSVPAKFHSERPVSIDAAHEIVYSSSTNSVLYGANNDDLMSLRGLLVDMFKEADDDGNGYLTFDEFEKLMSKVELGISSAELRYVIQEADDNDNGVVDYDEFVPLAVDMIQSFRARNKAKVFCSQRDSMIEEEVVTKMRSLDFDEMTQICIEKIQEYDPKKFGMLRLPDMKKALISVSFSVGLTEQEIQMICSRLPIDAFGRTLYNNIGEVLQKVRFINLKLMILESQATELHRELLDMCKYEERMLRKDLSSDDQSLTGELPVPLFSKVLTNYNKLTLSRLQILVIMAESGATDGTCNYQSFLPIVAKTIEYMFEPKALRQRAELIENSEITSEGLSKSIYVNAVEFDHRLRALYQACDIDSSNGLDEEEFLRCLLSLELELTGNEIRAYYSLLHTEQNGGVSYEDFKDFFVKNIAEMERVKHMRILQSRLHKNHEHDNPQTAAELSIQKKELVEHLTSLFEALDIQNSGFVEHHELEEIIKGLDIDLTPFQLDVLFSEVETDAHGFVDYHSFLPVCADLLQAFIAKQYADVEDHKHELAAEEKASRIVSAQMHEIKNISKKLYAQIQRIEADNRMAKTAVDKLHLVQHILRGPHSGLTRTEANDICSRLFESKLIVHENADGDLEVDGEQEDLSGNKSPPRELRFREDGSLDVDDESTSPKQPKMPTGKLVIQKGKPGTRAQSMIVRSHSDDPDAVAEIQKAKKLVRSTTVVIKKGKVNLAQDSGEVQIMKKADRLMKGYSPETFCELIAAARKRSVMRGMIHTMSKSAVGDFILHSMEHRRNLLVTEGKLDPQSIYLPTRVCYQVLEDAPALRLSRSQIMGVISTADAFDKTGLMVDFRRFASNASHVIDKLFDPHHQLNRANVMDIASAAVDEAVIMNGLTEADCNFYLETAFSELSDADETVDNFDFLSVVKDIPLLRLIEKDAVTVFSAAEHGEHGDRIHWRSCLPWMYETLHILLKERFIQRRMALLAATVAEEIAKQNNSEAAAGVDNVDKAHIESIAENEALQSLKSLAEKLVDFVKVRMDGGVVKVYLPTDTEAYGTDVVATAEKQADDDEDALESFSVLIDIPSYRMSVQGRGGRRGQLQSQGEKDLAATAGSTSKGATLPLPLGGTSGATSTLVSAPLGSFSELSELQAAESAQVASAAGAAAASSSGGAAKSVTGLRRQNSIQGLPATAASRIPAELVGHLKITASDREQTVDKELSVTFVAEGPVGIVTCTLPQSLKLPSMCVVDRENALEFAANLAAKLVVDMVNPMSMTHNLAIK